MKLSQHLLYFTVGVFAFSASYCIADDGISLAGFDPIRGGQVAQADAKKIQLSAKQADMLFHSDKDPIAGSQNSKITLVEFFDYRCSHCVAMDSTVQAIIHNNPDLQIIYKEYPIKGAASVFAAKAALAAQRQGKYVAFHEALMNAENLNEEKILNIASSIGLDIQKIKADMNSEAINQEVNMNYKIARAMGLQGTPAFFVTQTTTDAPTYIIPGEVDQTYLQKIIASIGR